MRLLLMFFESDDLRVIPVLRFLIISEKALEFPPRDELFMVEAFAGLYFLGR